MYQRRKRSQLRSSYEDRIFEDLKKRKIRFVYEPCTLSYIPVKPKKYTPDFFISDYNIYIEAKGYFTSKDRTKMLLIKEQHPDKKFKLLFQNARNKLSKSSKTTYAMWAEQHGFEWAEGMVPKEWLKLK